jgi:undecaprenyl-diphosphatase
LSAARLDGRAVAPARFFTAMGRTWALTAVACVFATTGVVRGGSALPIAILFASQTLSQGAIAVLKARFARPRPTAWLVRLERGRSYPSGHAATAVIFFVPLALVTLHGVPRTPADLFYVGPPASAAAAAVAAVALGCTLGIPWSRIVLGAHFLSDVAGGLLFGCAWTLALAAILIP